MRKKLTFIFFLISLKLSSFNLFRIEILGNGFVDETVVVFSDLASDSFNVQEDSYKLFSPVSGVPGICTKVNNYYLAINQFGVLNSDKTVEVVLKIQANTIYTLKATDLVSIDQTSQIFLEDVQNGIMQDLRQDLDYSVQLQSGMIENRFYLHFKSPLILSPTVPSCLNNDAILYVNYNSSQEIDIQVRNENGDSVGQLNNFNGQDTISSLNSGNYGVYINYPNGYMTTTYMVVTPNYPVDNYLWASVLYALPNENITLIVFNTNTTTNIWNFGDGVSFSTSHNNIIYSYDNPGQYNIKVISENGNCSDTSSVTINIVFPNGIIKNEIKSLNSDTPSMIYDVSGKEIDLRNNSNLRQGFYIVKNRNTAKKIYIL